MLSRVAESIYWVGRYVERAENTARLVSLNMNLLLDMPGGARPSWSNMVKITGSDQLFNEHYKNSDELSVVRFMLTDAKNPSSMLNSLAAARENARTIRDIIPQGAWEQINALHNTAKEKAKTGIAQKHRTDYLSNVIKGTQTLNGLFSSTMLHDSAYHFLKMGRSLERADMTTRIVDELSSETTGNDPSEEAKNSLLWMGLLRTLSANQMYRREMEVAVEREAVLEFLFRSNNFPRSITYCLNLVEECLGSLPRFKEPLKTTREARKLVQTVNQSELTQEQLHTHIDELQLAMVNVNNSISNNYFSLV